MYTHVLFWEDRVHVQVLYVSSQCPICAVSELVVRFLTRSKTRCTTFDLSLPPYPPHPTPLPSFCVSLFLSLSLSPASGLCRWLQSRQRGQLIEIIVRKSLDNGLGYLHGAGVATVAGLGWLLASEIRKKERTRMCCTRTCAHAIRSNAYLSCLVLDKCVLRIRCIQELYCSSSLSAHTFCKHVDTRVPVEGVVLTHTTTPNSC